LCETLMIRRMKADTLRDLPAKERLQITVDPDPHMAQELQSAKVGYSRKLGAGDV